MALRFQKRITLIPGIRLNFGKKGISVSIGPHGYSMNFGSKGTFANLSIPGTGLSTRRRLRSRTAQSNHIYNSQQLNDKEPHDFNVKLAVDDNQVEQVEGQALLFAFLVPPHFFII